MSSEPIRGDLSDFFHSSDHGVAPAAYSPRRVWLFHCVDCGRNLPEGDYWPKFCLQRHINLKNQTPAFLTFHCGRCGINLGDCSSWPVDCAQGHSNDARPG